MKRIVTALALVSLLTAKENASPVKWELEAAGSMVADGNMGINRAEESGLYFVPELGGELSFRKIPLNLSLDLAWEGFLEERDVDDLKPVIEGALAVSPGSEQFRNRITLSGSLYGGTGLYRENAVESDGFTLGMRTVSLENRMKWKREGFETALSLEGTYRDFGKTAEGESSDNTSIDLDITPELVWKKAKSGNAVQLRTVELSLLWRERFAVNPDENQRKQKLSLGFEGKAGHSTWEIKTGGTFKKYAELYRNELTGESESLSYWELFLQPEVKLPLPAGFSITLSGELARRLGTVEKYDFWNNRALLGLHWKIKG